MSIALDASVSLAWLFDDEATAPIDDLFDAVAVNGAFVPGIWGLEVLNGLRTAVRRHRMTSEFRDAALARMRMLPIAVDLETHAHAWSGTLRLADRHDLTPYDAAYLELAQRKRVALATIDRRLRTAAESEGIPLF